MQATTEPKTETVQQWKERGEVADRNNLRKYQHILTQAHFVLDNSTNAELRAFAQILINISKA